MARAPQPSIPPFLEQPPAPAPGGPLVALATALLLVVSMLGTIVKEIAKRWRGVVVAHLFFLTLWMAVQVFFFATGAYWCLPSNSSAVAEWISKYMTHIARCGAAPRTMPALQGSTAVAAPAPFTVPATPLPTAPTPAAPPRASIAPSPVAPPAVAAPAPTAPASGAMQGWSSRAVQNCWRNRAVDSGGCYDGTYPPRSALPPPEPPPRYALPPPEPPPRPIPTSPDGVAGFYYRYPGPLPPSYPCRRGYDCGQDDYYWPDYDR